jgi:predicted transcriptional regulator
MNQLKETRFMQACNLHTHHTHTQHKAEQTVRDETFCKQCMIETVKKQKAKFNILHTQNKTKKSLADMRPSASNV